MTVATDYENTIVVSDFRKATTTIEDTNNPGRYHLAGGTGLAQVEAPYLIVYTESDQSFNISLELEPLADTRRQAEQYLMQNLGITQDDMCWLRYAVLVPYEVNQIYAGKNLGFSFCPGATQL